MSSLSRGFIRDSRFGSGQVIKGANRETSRKWRAVADPTAAVPNQFVTQGTCQYCGQLCCNCVYCVAFKGGDTCDVCRRKGEA